MAEEPNRGHLQLTIRKLIQKLMKCSVTAVVRHTFPCSELREAQFRNHGTTGKCKGERRGSPCAIFSPYDHACCPFAVCDLWKSERGKVLRLRDGMRV